MPDLGELVPEEVSPSKAPGKLKRRLIGGLMAGTLLVPTAVYAFIQTQRTNSLQSKLAQANARANGTQNELQQLAEGVARLNDIPVGVITGSSLRNIPSAPDNLRTVDKSLQEQSDRATVEVLEKFKGDSGYYPFCTGTKVSSGANFYILLANHCLKTYEDLPSHGGPLPDAVNITHLVVDEFAIAEPARHFAGDDSWEPVANVDNVAVDESNETDWALMQVAPTPAFQALSSIALSNVINSSEPNPIVGEAVSLYSLPAANDNAPVSESGVYLGTVSGYTIGGLSSYLELVGVSSSQPYQDACNFGSSGSTERFASGQISGPLSYRNNIGYGRADTFYAPDSSATDQTFRYKLEAQTGFNLDGFNTICGYSVPIAFSGGNQQPAENTVQNLITVLEHPEEVISYTGGK